MAAEARRKGLHIRAFSGFRDFAYQKKLYLDAVDKGGPKQDGTAAPGYSEHQLGTTADICGDSRRTILSGKFGDTPEGRWLHENSEKYGFRKSYTTENSDEVGYKPEPWHFRYIGIAQNNGSRDVANK
jgi:D-alanyl-D-alanine carboxypeptidase